MSWAWFVQFSCCCFFLFALSLIFLSFFDVIRRERFPFPFAVKINLPICNGSISSILCCNYYTLYTYIHTYTHAYTHTMHRHTYTSLTNFDFNWMLTLVILILFESHSHRKKSKTKKYKWKAHCIIQVFMPLLTQSFAFSTHSTSSLVNALFYLYKFPL